MGLNLKFQKSSAGAKLRAGMWGCIAAEQRDQIYVRSAQRLALAHCTLHTGKLRKGWHWHTSTGKMDGTSRILAHSCSDSQAQCTNAGTKRTAVAWHHTMSGTELVGHCTITDIVALDWQGTDTLARWLALDCCTFESWASDIFTAHCSACTWAQCKYLCAALTARRVQLYCRS